MIRSKPDKTVTAALVVLPDTAPAGLYSLMEVFSSVGTVWEDLTGNPAGEVRIKVDLVAEHDGLMHCGLGVPVMPDATFGSASGYDLVVVPDMRITADLDTRGQWPVAVNWIRSQFAAGAIVGSICTGALLLAETGLLDNMEATTYWGAVPLFRELYPQIQLKPERILSLAGPGQRIITAGGASSWVEFSLYLISHFCGQEEAVRISKVFLLGDRSEGQLPFAALIQPRRHADAIIEKCQVWIAEHYEVANPVEHMTECSGLESRTFKRRFRAATGYSPLEYAQTLRIEEAKHLLETSDMPMDLIGVEVGYEDPASFRRLFKRMTGVTPSRYRRRFQDIGRLS
jgi:transcriptional regulator GlxA family with amidase domain